MASRQLNVTITGDARSLNRALGSVESQTGKVETRMTRFSSVAKGAMIGAAVGGTALLVKGLSDSVSAAARAEKSQARLQAQLRASGISYRAHAAEIDKAIQKTSQLSALDDEDLQDAFTNIVRITGDVSRSLRLTGLAADFARAKHLDVAKAGEIVGKVAGGNIGILSRYGITIEKGATATEALGKLQQRFAGQAAAYGRTTAGAQERFRVATENLQEAIGKKLTPVLARAFNAAAKFITQMQNGTGAGGRFAKAINEIAATMRPWVALTIRAGSVVASNFDKIAGAIHVATTANRALFKAFQSVASAEISVANKAVAAGKAIGGGLASAASSVAGVFRSVAGAVQSVIDKVNALLSLIPRIKIPHISIPHIGSANRATPNLNPGPSLSVQAGLAGGEVAVELAPEGSDAQKKAKEHYKKLLTNRLTDVKRRLKIVQKALRKHLSGKTRRQFLEEEIALFQEISSLLGELGGIADDGASAGADSTTSADAGGGDVSTGDVVAFDAGPADTSVATSDTSGPNLVTAIKELTDEVAKQNSHSEAILRTNWRTAVAALADNISGEIAGYGGYLGKAATAGAGSTYRL